MNALAAVFFVSFVLLTPLSLHVTAAWSQGLAGRMVLRVWHAPIRRAFHMARTADGGQRLMLRGHGHSSRDTPAPPPSLRTVRLLWDAFRRCDKARAFLLRCIQLDTLSLNVHVGLSDAAQTAVVSGALTALFACLPKRLRCCVRLCAAPDYFAASTSAWGDAALSVRLGGLVFSLLLFALGLAVSYIKERRAAQVSSFLS